MTRTQGKGAGGERGERGGRATGERRAASCGRPTPGCRSCSTASGTLSKRGFGDHLDWWVLLVGRRRCVVGKTEHWEG